MPEINVAIGERTTRWTSVPTRRTRVDDETIAYRGLGVDGGTSTILLIHPGAILDGRDPRIVDVLAVGHRATTVDPPGVGGSMGRIPRTGKGMADAARAFTFALGLTRIDLVGFSLGGFAAQQAALEASSLVRRPVLTGTGPAGGRGINRSAGVAYVCIDMLCAALARTDAKESLFFPRTLEGKAAAHNYLARVHERVMDWDTLTILGIFRAQLAVIKGWGRQQSHDLSRITAPTLIANSGYDRMVPVSLSEDMRQRIPNSTLVICPDAGHGDVFHRHQEPIPTLLAHLDT